MWYFQIYKYVRGHKRSLLKAHYQPRCFAVSCFSHRVVLDGFVSQTPIAFMCTILKLILFPAVLFSSLCWIVLTRQIYLQISFQGLAFVSVSRSRRPRVTWHFSGIARHLNAFVSVAGSYFNMATAVSSDWRKKESKWEGECPRRCSYYWVTQIWFSALVRHQKKKKNPSIFFHIRPEPLSYVVLDQIDIWPCDMNENT